MFRIADHPVVEARADGEQHVAVLHRHVRFVRSVHAGQAGELRIGSRQPAQSHQSVRARIAELADETRELRRRIVQDDAAARIDHRPLRIEQELNGLLDLPRVAFRDGVVRTERDRLRIIEFRRRLRHIFGDVDEDRSRSSRRGEIKRLLERDGEVLHILHEKVVLDARARDADRVAFLERILTDRVRRDLSGNDDERDRIHVRGRNSGHRVRHPRTRRHQRDADLVRRARIPVGSVDRALFVTHQHMLDLVLLEELVVDVEDRAARVAEDVLDAFLLQATDDDFCPSELHGSPPQAIDEHVCPASLSRPGICKTRHALVRRSSSKASWVKAGPAAPHRVLLRACGASGGGANDRICSDAVDSY